MKSLKDAAEQMKRTAERIAAEHGIEVDWSIYDKPRTPEELVREMYAVPEGACPYCGGRGWFTEGLASNEQEGESEDFASRRRFCSQCETGAAMYRRSLHLRVGNAQLPPRYEGASWDDFINLPKPLLKGKLAALYACQEFARHDGVVSMRAVYERGKRQWELPDDVIKHHLVLHGEPSLGKTTLLAATVNALLAKDRVVLYQRLPDLLETISQSYGMEGNPSAEIERQVIQAPFLMLDEMEVAGYQQAQGLVSTNKINIVERMMRSRMYDNRPTLITTNLDVDGMYKRWGVQIAAVLEREAHWVKLDGEKLSNSGQAAEWETW